MKETVILVPVYNDQASLQILLSSVEQALSSKTSDKYSFLIVNDGSTEKITLPSSCTFPLKVLSLYRNLGHQKAIAIGMAYVQQNMSCDQVLIMDSDGEDRPEDVSTLLQTAEANPYTIVFAYRKSRQENFSFRVFYFFYKLLFRWLTGKKIASGNFMVIPKKSLNKLVYYNEIWSHLSAGILKSELPFVSTPIDRGKRYEGKSKMGFTALVLHGLGAITVFLERVASRLLLISFSLIIFSLLVILIIIFIRSFTDLAIPGWASTILSSMLIVLLQGSLLCLFTIFLFLSSQSQRKFIPVYHYKDYVSEAETITHA